MPAVNDVTGDAIVSKHANNDAYAKGWEPIFGKKEETEQTHSEDEVNGED